MTDYFPISQARLRQMEHDLKQSLHVIQTGLTVLPMVRDCEQEFSETCAAIDSERARAAELIRELFAAARISGPSS